MQRDQFTNKVLHFATALTDVYKVEEEKEINLLVPLELKEDELTEDFTAMIYAMWTFYKQITEEDLDILGFTHIINRLVVLKLMRDNGVDED